MRRKRTEKGEIAVKKAMRIMAIALTILFVLFIAVSLSLIVIEAGHDCTGDDCPICEHICALTQSLRIAASFLLIAIAFLAAVNTAGKASIYLKTEYKTVTPVALKIKLSN